MATPKFLIGPTIQGTKKKIFFELEKFREICTYVFHLIWPIFIGLCCFIPSDKFSGSVPKCGDI